jgi:hypothetical protein
MKRTFPLVCTAIAAFALIAVSDSVAAPQTGSTTWGNWSFSWTVGGNSEGLEIKDVRWKNVKVLYKGSMPVIRVKYDSSCGPYADRLNWGNMVTTSCQNEKLCQRQWGDDLLELGAYSKIGKYDIYQAWYFTKSGRLEAAMWSKGWHCNVSHRHHPYWRMDFDVAQIPNRTWRRRTVSSNIEWKQYTTEQNEGVPTSSDPLWWIQDTSGAHAVIVRPWNTDASDSFGPFDASVRRYKYSEDTGWMGGASSQLGFDEGEALWDQDNVYWWIGHLSHPWNGSDPGGTHWHWVGPTLYTTW